MPDWQGYGFLLHVRQGIAFFTALKTEIRVTEKPIIGRFMLVFWRFYALRDTGTGTMFLHRLQRYRSQTKVQRYRFIGKRPLEPLA